MKSIQKEVFINDKEHNHKIQYDPAPQYNDRQNSVYRINSIQRPDEIEQSPSANQRASVSNYYHSVAPHQAVRNAVHFR